jgi:hypothetical protein
MATKQTGITETSKRKAKTFQRLQNPEPTQVLCVALPRSLHRRIVKEAAVRNWSAATLVRVAVGLWLAPFGDSPSTPTTPKRRTAR